MIVYSRKRTAAPLARTVASSSISTKRITTPTSKSPNSISQVLTFTQGLTNQSPSLIVPYPLAVKQNLTILYRQFLLFLNPFTVSQSRKYFG
jgi:hypothetical protein